MATVYYPLKNNPALVDLVTRRRKNGQAFAELRAGDVKGACDQLTPEDLKRLEELTDPKTK